jgi:serine/threonine protein kinase
VPALISKTTELVAGYSLQERIGSGGYGEVWRAEAPGGLLKAIKFIYGRFDEERASTELKALHRIKEVRHPFLLSLERIEVIDGQLVIVTELADISLSERFEACKAAGMTGIPRQELLRYLHDAADALDYMSEQFQLQHLDIKPENLLILGGRVKVADFGLVKDVQDVTVSLMGGMTPIYAAPEVFDGHPSLHSDQYSLAIVYQEMLSGVLPFPGKTPAQLTSQHLHGNPRLTPLPTADRTIIGRALDKDPQHRFSNCRELVEALQGAVNVESAAGTLSPPEHAPKREIYRTLTLSNMEPSCDTEAHSHRKPELLMPAAPQESRDPPEREPSPSSMCSEEIDANVREKINTINSFDHSQEADVPSAPPAAEFENLPACLEPFTEVKLRPTFVIGAGGTAARVLKQLQYRWRERFGSVEEVPIFETLLFDTDPHISERTHTAIGHGRNLETEFLPLKKPEDYRDSGDQLMRWLGHRWIYNIPRSLHTEGLRPLGRLALIDNAKRASARIREVLKSITSPASLEAAAKQTKLPIVDSSPLIYVVAAISGGTGSGMILDLAYAVRQALAEEGIASARICGILLHGTSRHAAEKKLSIANSYACLRELHAYGRRHPGEPAWNMPAAKEGSLPFDDTYFIHLGDDIGESQMNASTEKIAEYLDLDTTTACRGFFEQCRTASESPESSPAPSGYLRSMGLSRLGFTPDDIPTADIESLCRNLVDHWRQSPLDAVPRTVGPNIAAPAPATRGTAAAAMPENQRPFAWKAIIDFEFLAGKVNELVHEQINRSDENALQETLDKSCQFTIPSEEPENPVNRAQKNLDILYSTVRSLAGNEFGPAADADGPVLPLLCKLVDAEGDALRSRILQQSEDSENGLAGLPKIIEDILLELHEREREVFQRQERLREIVDHAELLLPSEFAAEKSSWLGRLFSHGKSAPSVPRWSEYARWRLEMVVLHGQRQLWHDLHERLTTLNEQLREMREELQSVSQEFQRTASQAKSSEAKEASAFYNLLNNAWEDLFRKHRRILAGKLERRLRRMLLDDCLDADNSDQPISLAAKARTEWLRNLVRRELSNLLREIDFAGLVLSSAGPEENAASLKTVLQQAQSPLYSNYGGAQRLLLACPGGETTGNIKQKVEAALQMTPSVAQTSSPEIIFCYEVERIPLQRIAAQLLENYDECRAIASKLRTRIDMSWPRDF